jgi:DNA-binding NarL/FixJ family response regulator
MKTAIVVEDHADTRDWLQQLLQKAFPEIEVETAPTLEWARELIEKQRFNLALIDMNLPDGSGVELIRELSKKYPDTYCVVATIYDDDEHLFSAMQAGAHGYLLKDQAEAQLLERLRRIASCDISMIKKKLTQQRK